MGAFAWQLRCRAHTPTYYNVAHLDLHAVIVRAELGSGQHRLLAKRAAPRTMCAKARRFGPTLNGRQATVEDWLKLLTFNPVLDSRRGLHRRERAVVNGQAISRSVIEEHSHIGQFLQQFRVLAFAE